MQAVSLCAQTVENLGCAVDATQRIGLYCCKCENVFMQSTHYPGRILMKLELARQFSEKVSNIRYYQNPSSGSRVVPCGQTDGRT